MSDPFLDEDGIIALLTCAPIRDNVARLQTGAVQALADLYDRKVTRQEFLSGASLCLSLYSSAARMDILASTYDVFENGTLSTASFEKASGQLQDLIRVQCDNTIELVRRLQKCPTSQDKIH